MIELVDTHCHLGYDSADDGGIPTPDELVARARESGVLALVDVGIDVVSSHACIARALANPTIWASAGLHPNSCAKHRDELAEIEELAHHPSCVAIGETGLDLYRDTVPLDVQLQSLEAHLDLSRRLRKPIILHCRDAFPELANALRAHAPVNGILHCFTGTRSEATACLDLGLRISFAGPLTYPKNDALRDAARMVPADRLLVETDAPFLPPQSRRGKRNEPAAVLEVATKLADVRGEALVDVAFTCTTNSFAQFGVAEGVFRSSSPSTG